MARKAFSVICCLFLSGFSQNLMAQGEPIIFSATGDVPYGASEIPTFQQQIADHNLYSPSEFFVHLGDIKQQDDPNLCPEYYYSDVASYLRELAVPVFIVPGDNETTECTDPVQAWDYWVQYFMNFELNFCGAPFAEKQTVRPENFAFVSKGVLFVGINLVTSVATSIQDDDADWVEQQFTDKVSQVRGAVIFSQCGYGSSRDTFFDRFFPAAQTFAKPVLFMNGDKHTWVVEDTFGVANVMRIQVDNGGDEEPVQITVTMDDQDPAHMFNYLRNPLSPPLYNVMPCVEAGPDQQIDFAITANLEGRATDDGVPTSPGMLTSTWSKISGPGVVTFGNPNDDTTTASFSIPGTYVLRLSADDGALQNYDELTVGVAGIAVISPNGGESWQVGSSENITWNSSGSIANVKLEYSSDNGANWNVITASTTNDGTEAWTIPNNITVNALVRVSDALDGDPVDVSDAVFSIVAGPSLTVTSPNGGESWQVSSSQNITWNSSGSIANVKLDYSSDNGANWNVITASTTNDGTEPWTVPNDITTTALVRVSDAVDGDPVDVSDAVFSIVSGPSLTVTSPNGGEIWQGDNNETITWNSTGTSGTVHIEYSTDSGLSWGDIYSNTTDDGSESWTVPDIFTAEGLVRISDTDVNGPADISDAVFTIIPASASVVSFQDGVGGYSGTRDTNIKEASPNTPFGSDTPLQLDGHPKDEFVLLSWDVTSIPAGSNILSVRIDVSVTHASVDTYELYEVKRPWIEAEATWNEYGTGQSWQTAGANGTLDRGSVVLANLTPSVIGSNTIVLDTAGIDTVQSWISSPSSNHGFIIMNPANNGQADFSSREAAIAAEHPKLTVIYTPPPVVLVETKVFLEGPYNVSGDSMRTDLRDNNLVPNTSPYSEDPRLTSQPIPPDITDWVLVELRETPSGAAVAHTSALLRSDGRIVADDGITEQIPINASEGNYYVVIKNRNHLAVMSAGTMLLSNGSATLYDFTTSQSAAYTTGVDPMSDLGNGKFGMCSGDGNSDNGVDAIDYNTIWLPENGTPWNYSKLGDFNLDGGIDAIDYNLHWLPNNGRASQVP